MAAFAASDGNLDAYKHSFKAWSWRVMPQQDGAFHLRRRLRRHSRSKQKRGKNSHCEDDRSANFWEGHDAPHLRIEFNYNQYPISSRCACRDCELRIGFLKLPRRPANVQQLGFANEIVSHAPAGFTARNPSSAGTIGGPCE
jgi:hypothetical protein